MSSIEKIDLKNVNIQINTWRENITKNKTLPTVKELDDFNKVIHSINNTISSYSYDEIINHNYFTICFFNYFHKIEAANVEISSIHIALLNQVFHSLLDLADRTNLLNMVHDSCINIVFPENRDTIPYNELISIFKEKNQTNDVCKSNGNSINIYKLERYVLSKSPIKPIQMCWGVNGLYKVENSEPITLIVTETKESPENRKKVKYIKKRIIMWLGIFALLSMLKTCQKNQEFSENVILKTMNNVEKKEISFTLEEYLQYLKNYREKSAAEFILKNNYSRILKK